MYNHDTSTVNQQLHDVNPSPCQELPPTIKKERRMSHGMLDPQKMKKPEKLPNNNFRFEM